MKKLIAFFVCCAGHSLFAAAALTHVHFANLWLDQEGISDPAYRREFIAGTLFPDIRYEGEVSRGKTHEKGVTQELVRASKTPFLAGARFHCFVDETRESYIKKRGIIKSLSAVKSSERVGFLKLLEDEIYWERADKACVEEALSFVWEEGLEFGVSKKGEASWRSGLLEYFAAPPSLFLEKRIAEGRGFAKRSSETLVSWQPKLVKLASNRSFQEYADRLEAHMLQKMR